MNSNAACIYSTINYAYLWENIDVLFHSSLEINRRKLDQLVETVDSTSERIDPGKIFILHILLTLAYLLIFCIVFIFSCFCSKHPNDDEPKLKRSDKKDPAANKPAKKDGGRELSSSDEPKLKRSDKKEAAANEPSHSDKPESKPSNKKEPKEKN